MKKYFYIGAFMFLGFLVSMLVHAGLEIPALAIITRDPTGPLGSFLSGYWWLLHGVGGRLLSLLFVLPGLFLGKRFWHILYVEKRYGTPRW